MDETKQSFGCLYVFYVNGSFHPGRNKMTVGVQVRTQRAYFTNMD